MTKTLSAFLFMGTVLTFFTLQTPAYSAEKKAESYGEKLDRHPQVSIQEPVLRLKDMLAKHPEIKKQLIEAIQSAKVDGVNTLEEYYQYLQHFLTWAPIEDEVYQKICQFYWFLDQPTGRALQKDKVFRAWMVDFVHSWGKFLDTVESAKGIPSFLKAKDFHIQEAAQDPSGWMTFNQFFARNLKPGVRPIEGLCDEAIVVSPADSTLKKVVPITEISDIVVKGLKLSIEELLKDSPYKDKFADGLFVHSFLNVNDYHRFHTPVAGIVREVRDIPGEVFLDVIRKENHIYEAIDGTGYQFTQARGLFIIESPTLGHVAVLPIGMAHVSSVVLTPEVGAKLEKGQEFGYFVFGGSDIIMLFEKDKVQFTAEKDKHHKVGVKIGVAK